MGHSMGGAGALSIALKNTKEYKSVSAFSPISDTVESDFCTDAMKLYFGNNQTAAEAYSPVRLIQKKIDQGIAGPNIIPPSLVYTGTADQWEKCLQSSKLKDIAGAGNLDMTFKMQAGYDHSYNFISTFIEDHIAFHAMWLKTG